MLNHYLLNTQDPITSIAWPNIPNQAATCSLGMLHYLASSQWLPPVQIKQLQNRQLAYLLQQASNFVPYYRDQDYGKCTAEHAEDVQHYWQQIPIINRQIVQLNSTRLQHNALSSEHGTPVSVSSSGSTGQPVSVLSDVITQFFFNVLALRHYYWHQYDFRKKMAVIRDLGEKNPSTQGIVVAHWGSFTQGIIKTSPCYLFPLCDVGQQAQWLKKTNPNYLMCYPTVLKELLALNKPKPSHLESITTFGEVVDESLRQAVKEQWNIPLVDIYSSSETGYIALQCPHAAHYHVQEEGILVEILDNNNKPCQPGTVGRVVLTPLHNLASPLLRYEIGDYAEVGEPCACGRGLSVITRILGRQRNMIQLPTGEKRWPTFTGHSEVNLISLFKEMQFQVVQKSPYDIEISIVCPLSRLAEQELIPSIQHILGYPFNITFNYVSSIARAANGKFEDFKCLI